jgi:hypothetical protein
MLPPFCVSLQHTEAEKLDTPAPLGMLPENFSGSDFKSGEQCRRAVPL